jgi:hypothetical protein
MPKLSAPSALALAPQPAPLMDRPKKDPVPAGSAAVTGPSAAEQRPATSGSEAGFRAQQSRRAPGVQTVASEPPASNLHRTGALTMMRSGGTRKNTQGQTLAFYVRQSPENLTAADWPGKFQPMDKSVPWSIGRSTAPEKTNLPVFGALSEADQLAISNSPDYPLRQENGYGKATAPSKLARALALLKAKHQGNKVPHSWIYQQVRDPEYDPSNRKTAQYAVQGSRLYVSVAQKNVAGTEVSLPTRQIELYEVNRDAASGAAMPAPTPPPAEVQAITAYVAQTSTEVPLDQAGKVALAASVDCHELGKNFLLYRAKPFEAGQKRPLLVIAHGSQTLLLEPASAPEGVALTYFGPQGKSLLGRINLTQFPLDAVHTGPADDLECDLHLTKFGSPIHDVSQMVGLQPPHLLSNAQEGAAWIAHDYGMDVLTLRHNKGKASQLSAVGSAITEAGLGNQYNEFRVFACRPPFYDFEPSGHDIGANLT